MEKLILWLGTAIALIGADRLVAGPERLEPKDYKSVPEPIVEQPPCRWTGFYIGLHGGYGWGDVKLEEVDDEDPGFGHTQEGFIGGGQIGFNLQIGSWLVLGLEGDFAGSAIDETTHFTSADEPDETVALDASVDWIGSLGGRVGVTFWKNRFLLFAKGGVAFISFDNKLQEDDDGTFETFHSNHNETTGYIGGGLEYALTCHWALMFEYKHYFTDDDHDLTVHIEETGNEKLFNRDNNLDSVLFGVNYRF